VVFEVTVSGEIVIVRVPTPVPAEFDACRVMLYVPWVVGVPEMTPALLIESPAGRPVAA
jgi:hypothetical protein